MQPHGSARQRTGDFRVFGQSPLQGKIKDHIVAKVSQKRRERDAATPTMPKSAQGNVEEERDRAGSQGSAR